MLVGGITFPRVKNSDPMEFIDVKVTAANGKSWYPFANAKIRNFVAYTGSVSSTAGTSADGTHEVKTAFDFSGDAITVTDLVTSSVRGRDWSGFVKDILSKECTDYKVAMIDGTTYTFKFTGQYIETKPVFGYGGYQLLYAFNQWQLKKLDDGSVLGSVVSQSNCPEVSGWTWTDGSTTISQGISNISMMLYYMCF